uniref:C-type lectin domain-containing protein n=1 Tax=Callorhinchus milii TaxID=7868 RepID=A0A4W3KI50_CALMI
MRQLKVSGSFNGSLFRFWSPGEPNQKGEEDCVELDSRNGKWNDNSCNSIFYFICAHQASRCF